MVLEIKRGRIRSVSHVVEQLRAGAEFCQYHIPSSVEINFTPMVASGSLRKDERSQFRKSRNSVQFHNKKYRIQRIRCGAKLMQTEAFGVD